MSSGRIGIQDVADAAGVSSATVSRVLTGARSVRPESAAAVHAAVAQLNYRPNQLGRALRRQSTQVIGMVVPSIDNPFFPSVIQTVERNLRARGYALLLSTSEDDPRVEAERVEMLVDRQVDGLLISPCRRTESRAAVVDAAARVPLVQLDRAIDGRALDFVGVDDAQGIRSIVDLVTAIAPGRVAYLGGDVANWSGNKRHAEFVALAGERSRRLKTVVRLGEFSEAWGHTRARTPVRQATSGRLRLRQRSHRRRGRRGLRGARAEGARRCRRERVRRHRTVADVPPAVDNRAAARR